MPYDFGDYIREANFSKVIKILRGDVPHVNTMAIMTAFNPMLKQLSKKENEELNRKLKFDLKHSNYIPVKVSGGLKGKFGLPTAEDSFIIPHMSRDAAQHFGKLYDQAAVIWGQKITDQNGSFIRFEYMDRPNSESSFKTVQRRDVVITGEHAQKLKDNFSAMKMVSPLNRTKTGLQPGETSDTKKLSIPFFNDQYDKARYSADRRSIDMPYLSAIDSKSDDLRKIEFYIPFFDDIAAGYLPDCDVDADFSFSEAELPQSECALKLIEEVRVREQLIYDDKVNEHHKWASRGILAIKLMELKEVK